MLAIFYACHDFFVGIGLIQPIQSDIFKIKITILRGRERGGWDVKFMRGYTEAMDINS